MLINLFHVVSPTIRRAKKSCILCAETVLWMLVMGLFPAAAWSQDSHELPLKTFTLYWENDTFNGTDQVCCFRPKGYPGMGFQTPALFAQFEPFQGNGFFHRSVHIYAQGYRPLRFDR